MENWCFNQILWSLIILLPAFLIFLRRQKSVSNNRRPPGPRGWPVFGSMFDLGDMPHKTLAGLKKTYGPVLWLRIGSINTMVVQSSTAAAELFKNHDINFLDRSVVDAMKPHDYHKSAVSLAPYGTYWRVMRRMLTVDMMINKRLNETVSLRRKSVDNLISWIHKEITNAGKDTKGIHVSRFVFLASFNMVGNLLFSRDLVDPESAEGMEFFSAMIGFLEVIVSPAFVLLSRASLPLCLSIDSVAAAVLSSTNIVDLFPWLRWLDPQGIRRKSERDMGKTLQVVSKYLKECVKERQESGQKKKDYLELLLEFEGDSKEELLKLSDHDVNAIITEAFLAGTDTTSSTIEWAMVELLNNPITLSKLKTELNDVVGNGRRVEETDMDNLKYLQATIKETLRLHPPAPFLIPRRATQDTNFMGYDIPKSTQVFVNVFAIGRDPKNWDEPESFKPERFLGSSNIDFKGQHFDFISFGGGRRICPGIPLAHRMLNLMLGSLVHEFDWHVHNSEVYKIKDTRERMGTAVRKYEPLIAIPVKKRS